MALVALATLETTAAWVLVEAGQNLPLAIDPLKSGAAFIGLYTVGCFTVRRLAPYADPFVLPCVALLNGLGLVLIHRLDLASAAAAVRQGVAAPPGDVGNQMVWTAAGLVLFVGVLAVVRDHRMLARYAYTFAAAGLVLLLVGC